MHTPGIIPPRPTEVRAAGRQIHPVGGADVGPIDDVVTVIFLAVATVGGDESLAFHTDIDALEPGARSLAKDEVNGAVDVAVRVHLMALVSPHRVLVADELDPVVCLLVIRRRYGQRLPPGTASVLQVDIVHAQSGIVRPQRRRQVVS